MKSGGTYVLGTGLSHDGSACLLKDGEIRVAIEKERITRVKHDGGNDTDAVTYCLETEGIAIDDVSVIVQNANFGMLERGHTWWGGSRVIPERAPVYTISHHLAHAYSAIGSCPFEEAAVLVIDGCGNALDECIDLKGAVIPEEPQEQHVRQLYFEKDSYYVFRNQQLRPVFKDFSPWGMANRQYPMYPNTTLHSLGGMYLAASMYIFNGFEDPGKLMGLAPYGRPGVYDFEIFELREGRSFVRYDWMRNFNNPARNHEQLKDNFQYYADIAYWIQREIERAILYIVSDRYERGPCENLAYSGGVALNAVANARILSESPFRNVYIQPAAADNGLAVGCAYYGWLEILKRERRRHSGSTCFGRIYSHDAITQDLDKYQHRLKIRETADCPAPAAEALATGKIIAWYQGGAEFGPRALGHRSILADPRRAETRQFINAAIKLREDFRPFAPAVLAEDVSRYFCCDWESPYMILVVQVREEWRALLASVVHRDNSARIQTVTCASDPKFYELLCCFRRHTGLSVLLNTSFNRRRMPIVETPDQAIRFFLSCPLDLLVIGNYIVEKNPNAEDHAWNLTTLFAEEIRQGLEKNLSIASSIGGIYGIRVTGTRQWTIDLSQQKPLVIEGANGAMPDVSIELAEDDMRRLVTNPWDEGRKLLDEGKVRVDGNRASVANIAKILQLRQAAN